MYKAILYISSFFLSNYIIAQTIGGATVFNFLHQPNTATLSALGGVNISSINNSVGLAFNNPALLRSSTEKKYEASFNNYFAGIKNYSFTASQHFETSATTASAGINYFNYGNITQTDAAGNILGTVNLNDFVLQIQTSKQYKDNWFYGATAKFISSNYGTYKSNGIAVDVGLCYYDSTKKMQVGFVIKNIGSQLKTYVSNVAKTELPFDVELGITKRLQKAPFQFSLTAHHLQALSILYNDTTFNANEGYNQDVSFLKKIFSHFIVASEIFIGDKIKATISYNFLRRDDLYIYQSANGLSGFNVGLSILLKKLHFHYATGFYQQNMYHQVSIGF